MRLIIFFLSLFIITSAAAELRTRQAHSEVEIVSEVANFIPGSTHRVGLFFKLDSGWHTYWINPGDSGASLITEWSVPDGVVVTPAEWPTPQRFEVSNLQSFGYEDETLIYWNVHVPVSYSKEAVELKLSAEWLVCAETCLPADFEFKLTLPIGEKITPTKWQKKFDLVAATSPKTNTILIAKLNENQSTQELSFSPLKEDPLFDVDFFPLQNRGLQNIKPKIDLSDNFVTLKLLKSNIDDGSPRLGLLVNQKPSGERTAIWVERKSENSSLLKMLLFAFLGGLILNLMPCVFPILFLKAYQVINAKTPHHVRSDNFLYAAGVMVSMLILGGTLIVLRSSGESIGWGFQLQDPWTLSLLILLFFTMGLSFSGLFAVDLSRFTQISNSGRYQAFVTGVFSTIVASPCTAPFMGVAIGWALISSPAHSLLIFLSLGFGLSFPFCLLGTFPKLANYFPRPGRWMEIIKEFMAIPLFATALWLYSVLQAVHPNAIWILALCLFIYVVIWLTQKKRVFSLFFAVMPFALVYFLSQSKTDSTSLWEQVEPSAIETNISQSRLAFFNFTADWCITCKVNERTTFSSKKVQDFKNTTGIKFYMIDWTKKEPQIAEILNQYQRAGVPFYLFVDAEGNKSILPEVLTPDTFIDQVSAQLKTK